VLEVLDSLVKNHAITAPTQPLTIPAAVLIPCVSPRIAKIPMKSAAIATTNTAKEKCIWSQRSIHVSLSFVL
jgi:hypothetical protein